MMVVRLFVICETTKLLRDFSLFLLLFHDFVLPLQLKAAKLLPLGRSAARPLVACYRRDARIVAGVVFNVATRSYALQPIVYVYALLMCMGLIIY